MSDYRKLREKMVEHGLVSRGIKDERVINAFLKIPREEFIPEDQKKMAYNDSPVPIKLGQTISQPYIIALMTQCLDLEESDKVLEIGTGSGYQAAILAEIVSEVWTVERFPALLEYAKNNLKTLGYKNINFIQGDGTLGYEKEAPYEAIIVTAGAPNIPQPLLEQLNVGGRMVIPVGGSYSQILKKITKGEKKIEKEDICGCVFVPLIGKKGWGDDG